MAIDLKAVFRVQDNGTSKLRKIMQQTQKVAQVTDQLAKSNQQAAKAANTFRDANGRLRDANGRFLSESNKLLGTNGRLATSFGGLQSSIMGLVGAYSVAQGAAAAFNATIGAAAKFEQQSMALEGMFKDANKAEEYLKMLDRMAIESPVLNSSDMRKNSKAFVGLTKDMKQLEEMWGLTERLQAYGGENTDQTAFSVKDLFQGDYVSMQGVFGLDKKTLQKITKMTDLQDQIDALDELLNSMGVTEEMVQKMGDTTLGQWSSIREAADTFFLKIGLDANSRLSKALKGANEELSKLMTDSNASKLGDVLGDVMEKAIDVGKFLWKWKEPLSYIVGAVGTALTLFTVIGTLSLLANPISLIAAAIGAIAFGFIALYKESEPFQKIIEIIQHKIRGLYRTFKEGGMSGVLDAIFGDGTAEKVSSIIDTLKGKFDSLKEGFEIVKNALSNGWSTVKGIFTSAWEIIGPILEGVWSYLQIVGDIAILAFNKIIAPALSLAMQLFSALWSVVGPILSLVAEMFKLIASIIKWIWDNVLAPLVEWIMGAFANALESLSDALSIVAGWFETIGGWAETAKGYISQFADYISGIKLPDWVTSGISTVVKTVGNFIGAEGDGKFASHYHGLSNVPYDGYAARLHKGERVLTAQENKEYSQGGGFSGVTISGNTFNVRQESDIEKIAYKLAKYIEREALQID